MYRNINEATRFMFADTSTWPHVVLPIKRPNLDSAIMLETNGVRCKVAFGEGQFGANLWCRASWTNVREMNVDELIAAGWLVD